MIVRLLALFSLSLITLGVLFLPTALTAEGTPSSEDAGSCALASFLADRGDLKRAEREYLELFEMDPVPECAYTGYGKVLTKLNPSPTPDPYAKAKRLKELGRQDEAKDETLSVAIASPNVPIPDELELFLTPTPDPYAEAKRLKELGRQDEAKDETLSVAIATPVVPVPDELKPLLTPTPDPYAVAKRHQQIGNNDEARAAASAVAFDDPNAELPEEMETLLKPGPFERVIGGVYSWLSEGDNLTKLAATGIVAYMIGRVLFRLFGTLRGKNIHIDIEPIEIRDKNSIPPPSDPDPQTNSEEETTQRKDGANQPDSEVDNAPAIPSRLTEAIELHYKRITSNRPGTSPKLVMDAKPAEESAKGAEFDEIIEDEHVSKIPGIKLIVEVYKSLMRLGGTYYILSGFQEGTGNDRELVLTLKRKHEILDSVRLSYSDFAATVAPSTDDPPAEIPNDEPKPQPQATLVAPEPDDDETDASVPEKLNAPSNPTGPHEPTVKESQVLGEVASIWLFSAISDQQRKRRENRFWNKSRTNSPASNRFEVEWTDWRGFAYFRRSIGLNSNDEKAIEFLNKSLRRNPRFLPAVINLASKEMAVRAIAFEEQNGKPPPPFFYQEYFGRFEYLWESWGEPTLERGNKLRKDEQGILARIAFNYIANLDYTQGWDRPSIKWDGPAFFECVLKLTAEETNQRELLALSITLRQAQAIIGYRWNESPRIKNFMSEASEEPKKEPKKDPRENLIRAYEDAKDEWVSMANGATGQYNLACFCAAVVHNPYTRAAASTTLTAKLKKEWEELAKQHLERAFDQNPRLAQWARVDPSLQPLRNLDAERERAKQVALTQTKADTEGTQPTTGTPETGSLQVETSD